MDNANSGLTAADVLALSGGNGANGIMGGNGFWWVIIFFIIAGMFGGGNLFGGNRGGNSLADAVLASNLSNPRSYNGDAATTEYVSNQFSNQNDKFLAYQNQASINQTNRDVLETSFGTTKEVLENRYNNSLQTNQLQAQMANESLRAQMQISNNALENQMQMSNNALQQQMQLANCCCTLREEGVANTQKILDALCQNQIDNLREKLADRDRELQTARFQISQIDQTANLTNTLRPYPTPSYIVSSPYTSLYNPYYGYGYGVSGVV